MAGRQPEGGGWPAIRYVLSKAREAGGVVALGAAMASRNTCKTCAVGMGGQRGGMVDEGGHHLEFCKKSVQAMVADMQPALNPAFADGLSLAALQALSPRALEHAGRLATPLHRAHDSDRYVPINWQAAMARVGERLATTDPARSFFYFSGRSSNEAGFLLQLFARVWGTNNVNNCSYYCHQASGVGLHDAIGSGTASVVLADLERCDLMLIWGANPASNHPRLMKAMARLRRRGGKVVVINPLREPGLERFRVPSDARSLLLDPKVCDLYLQPRIGGDLALLTALAKATVARRATDPAFLAEHVQGWPELRAHLDALPWAELCAQGGVSEQAIETLADIYAASQGTIFAWAMGLTHHVNGVDNVQAVANLALLRGMVGRPGAGLLPLRGHSNVQGMGSMGVMPTLKGPFAAALASELGLDLPTDSGMDTLACVEKAAAGEMDLAVCLGGNLYGANPDARFAATALQSIGMSVTLSTTLNTGHAFGAGQEALILPVRARDEETQSTTQESMFSYVRLSDGGPARLSGPRSEVQVIAELATRAWPADSPVDWSRLARHDAIRSLIGRCVPGYGAIGRMDESGDEFQIAGRTFHTPRFGTASGKANMRPVDLPEIRQPGPRQLQLMTLRSEGQFNTVVYEEADLYRAQTRRDVILMNAADVRRLGLRADDLVTVRSQTGEMSGIIVRPFDIAPGCAAMYYPEANVLVSRRVDPRSRTPAYKDVLVSVDPTVSVAPASLMARPATAAGAG